MSIYSNLRQGNLVHSFLTDIDNYGYYWTIEDFSENGTSAFIRSMKTNDRLEVEMDDLTPIGFQPDQWGFIELSSEDYANSEFFLHNFTDSKGYEGGGIVEEVVDGIKMEYELNGVVIYSHLGYLVKRIDTDNWVIDGTEIEKDEYTSDDDEGYFIGLRYVHEYQNLYAIEFPHIELYFNPINAKP